MENLGGGVGMTLDKQAHFWAGMAIYGLAAAVLPPISAIFPVVVAAIGKELWDSRTHPSDWYDALYTVVGGATALLWNLLLK